MDGYSRLIALLKVFLPLLALAILSTLFLLSRDSKTVTAIPFAEADVQDRVQGQQITGSFFSATTTDGDKISLSAGKILTEGGVVGENTAQDVSAQIDLARGTRIILFADSGRVSVKDSQTSLSGNVIITTSTGYRMTTERLDASMDALDIQAPQRVDATGPIGRLDAGAMAIREPDGSDSPHLLFTNGVRLVYDMKNERE